MQVVDFNEQEIEITSVDFRTYTSEEQLDIFPKAMIYNGREYKFSSSGIRYLVKKGQELIKLFDVEDENSKYRLKFEGNRWALVGMKGLQS